MFRFLLFALLLYFGYKILMSFLRISDNKKQQVKGSKKGNPPLNLSDHDVEDAEFEDLD